MAIIHYHKKYTETLIEMLERFRIEYPEYRNSKITYAGRLDPMAEGVMILLTDDDIYQKEDYLEKDKIYTVECIFGPSTDSLDILGMIDEKKIHDQMTINRDTIKSAVGNTINIKEMEYPIYSSKTVRGKPLWHYAREGIINTIDIPKRNVDIKKAEYLGLRKIEKKAFADFLENTIYSINGDFRQEQIINSWKKYFKKTLNENFDIYNFRFHVSSGTYIRSLIQSIGNELGVQAVCVKITRESIQNIN